jgi:hypothetical protein
MGDGTIYREPRSDAIGGGKQAGDAFNLDERVAPIKVIHRQSSD